jgi:diguanylate cyclase (GGDEF)-like protein
VIKRVGEIIESLIRTTDKVARFGGEEFVVLLREVDEEGARRLAERIRQRIEASPIVCGQANIGVSVSIGIAIAAEDDRDIDDVIERADKGLYMAKNTGRNRIFFMPAISEEPQQRVA